MATPQAFTMASHPRPATPGPEFPARHERRVRAAIQPVSTGFELARPKEASRSRFLACTFPLRSPHPAHPAVPGRRDFAEAAPTLPGDPQVRLPPASPRRCDGKAMAVLHLHPVTAAPRGALPVIEDHQSPPGHITPDHAGDRGAMLLGLGASRSQAYQPDPDDSADRLPGLALSTGRLGLRLVAFMGVRS
jgi:hypothetical protein